MKRNEAKEEVKCRVPATSFLERSPKAGKNQYVCPFCGSGTGPHKTGALTYYPETNTWTCFSCGRSGDLIDLYQEVKKVDFNTALNDLARMAGITIDRIKKESYSLTAKNPLQTSESGNKQEDGNLDWDDRISYDGQGQTEASKGVKKVPQDFTTYYGECQQTILNHVEAVRYLEGRGISFETAWNYGIGFDPQADPVGAPGGVGEIEHPCPRLIIPVTPCHYVARSIDQGTKKEFQKLNNKGAKVGIFNLEALHNDENDTVFVCEGAFDALSILEVGAAAISLNSAGNAESLVKHLEERRTESTLILCLDNDERGDKAKEMIREGLQRLDISFVVVDICGGCKDPNDHIVKDREAFYEAIEKAQRQAAAKPDNVTLYIDHFMGADMELFRHEIKTGYENLDRKIGGLYSGLYCIAAITSLGKTTFAAQMADQIAAAGNDVIFFSLEQSRLELVAKSFARMTAKRDRKTAVGSLSIRKGRIAKQVLEEVSEKYKRDVGDRLSIVEGNFNCDISFIGDYIRRYIKKNNVLPVVFIDYLQVLQPDSADEKRKSTKEMVDHTVTNLKRLSRELGITIFAICSVNRTNYLTPIDFEALKESGSIEYTCDVVFGLQLECINDELFQSQAKIKEKHETIREAKRANPRMVELLCLKNRYGVSSFSTYFDYYPANDLFIPREERGKK